MSYMEHPHPLAAWDAFARWSAAAFVSMLGMPAHMFEAWEGVWRCTGTAVFGAMPMHVELRFLVPSACVQFIVATGGDRLTEAMMEAAGRAVGDMCGRQVVTDRLSKRACSLVMVAT
jgi:hypothetical protein